MISRPIHYVLTTLSLCVALFSSCFAAEALKHLPEDALGYALARDLEQVDAKVQQFTKLFSIDAVPAPLMFLNMATGLNEGLDREGDLLLALLPGEELTSDPIPMLLLPITDYQKFVTPIQGDGSGEISRVAIAGEEVLVAQQGDFALLMNLENRELMETIVARQASELAELAPLETWIAENDIVISVMPTGVKTLSELGRASLQENIEVMQGVRVNEEGIEALEEAEAVQPAIRALKFYDRILAAGPEEVETASLGVAMDDQQNLRVSERILLKADGQLAAALTAKTKPGSPLADYADQPIVGAGGGPMPAKWTQKLSDLAHAFIKNNPEIYGLEEIDEASWAKAQESWQKSIQDLRGFSMAVLPGKEEEPAYSNFYSMLTVVNSDSYLESYREGIEAWNSVMEHSTSDMSFHYEIEEVTISGNSGMAMVLDIMEMMGEQEMAPIREMMKAMFGADGKMRIYLVKIDETRLFSGVATEAQIEKLIKDLESEEVRLDNNEHIQTTLKQLDSGAQWMAVVSPQGVTKWFERMMTMMMRQFGGGMMPQFADYPPAPPVGLALRIEDRLIASEMVWPSETLSGLAEYIQAMEEAN